jgi:O-antigen biosynthesis protein WbqP
VRPRDPLLALAALASPWPWHRRVAKRALDLSASSLALIVLALPLAILGLILRLRSPGPALFFQERVGLRGRRFRVWKLRTMVAGAPALGPQVTAAGDPRVTPLGRLLRRTKLDELPQLWNILVGEMSFVGPRPCLPSQTALVAARRAHGVYELRPGITGVAQVAGVDMSDPVRLAALDATYLADRSIMLDLKLIAATFLGAGRGDSVGSRSEDASE